MDDAGTPVPSAASFPPHRERALVWAVVGAGVCLGLAWPVGAACIAWLWPVKRTLLIEATRFEVVRMALVQLAVGSWVFTLAATLGSFLNVVVHRLPQGRSVVTGRSSCPACGGPVLARDNIPVIGWLMLGGRCRWCHTEIAGRYPIVEALCGGMFLALWYGELLSGGATIPIREPNFYNGLVWIVLYPKWDLIGIFLYHVAMLSLLLVWSLIAVDRQRIPLWHSIVGLGVMTLLPMLFPRLHPVPVGLPVQNIFQISWGPFPSGLSGAAWFRDGLTVSLVGLLAGAGIMGALVAVAAIRNWAGEWAAAGKMVKAQRQQPSGGVVCGLLLIGVAQGWQAVATVSALAMILWAVGVCGVRAAGRFTWPWLQPEHCLLAAACAHLLAWRLVVDAVW